MDTWLDRRTVLIGVGLAAAAGIGVYTFSKLRQRKNKYAHLVLKWRLPGRPQPRGDLYEVPGTDYWMGAGYFDTKDKIENLEVYEDDVWVDTYPKAGTTWTQEIVWLVCNDADTEAAKEAVLIDRFRFIDSPYRDNTKRVVDMPRPRFVKSHLPIGLLPKQFMQVKPKIVYTTRNPKDTITSLYHFLRMFTSTDKSKLTLQAYFQREIDQAMHGGFWQHNLEAWKLRNEPFFLFLKFEDMIQDLPREVRKVATFLNKTLTEEQIQRIADHCSFKSMKDNPATNFSWGKDLGIFHKGETPLRKGEVGDWKNTLSIEQCEIIDSLTEQWLIPEGLTFEYE